MTAIFHILVGALLLAALLTLFLAAVITCGKCNGWCISSSDCELRRRKKGLL